jgi:hypothetical protein
MQFDAKVITLVGGAILFNQVNRYVDVFTFVQPPAVAQKITGCRDLYGAFVIRSLSPISFFPTEVTRHPPALIASITLVDTTLAGL